MGSSLPYGSAGDAYYAGFWLRAAATLIRSLILFVPTTIAETGGRMLGVDNLGIMVSTLMVVFPVAGCDTGSPCCPHSGD